MPKLPVASWCPLVSHRLTHGENQHYLCWTRREDKQCITVTVTTVTSYSDRVYYWTFVRDVVVKNGHYNKIVHHLTLIETLCVTCSVTMLLSLNQTDMWPPNSPDLNPVDYAVWETLQQLVYQHRSFTSVAELKQAIVNAWQELSQSFIDRSINEWRRHLECVVYQNGGHIEHLFK